MRPYCTIFNSLYLLRGLALFSSLARHAGDFRLYVFAMDDTTAEILERIGDERLIIVRPAEFEDVDLLAVKSSRTLVEYFWTCTPSIMRYCIRVRGESECTYLDADVWLFADPSPLFDEMGSASILLTEHRYAPRHEQSALSGRFCVQFLRIRGTPEGLHALQWWRERCLEWCFARRENGRFGDQKYLDDWPTRFQGVHVLSHLGGGVAPWNVGRFHFRRGKSSPEISADREQWKSVVFFHFHGMRSYDADRVCYAFGYRLSVDVKTLIYVPYLQELVALYARTRPLLAGMAATGIAPSAFNNGRWFGRLLRKIYGFPNTHSLESLLARAALN